MNTLLKPLTILALGAVAVVSFAQVEVEKGKDIDLKFMQSLSSKTAVIGQSVKLAVMHDVMEEGKLILKAGTPVMGVITKVDKRDHFGKNARIRLAINPVKSLYGEMIPLQPRDKQSVTGRRSDTAGAASVGGAAVLGPIGLVGGYFVVGKPVKVQVGDPLYTQVSRTVILS
jgi:hypothetical protein